MSWLGSALGWYEAHATAIGSVGKGVLGVGTLVTAGFVARAALQQARSATAQAVTARERHEEQTKADRERRRTESFAKAVEALDGEKVQGRLGGIYTLERIARESLAEKSREGSFDYWAVFETLCAFARERGRWVEKPGDDEFQRYGHPSDMLAVIGVILRRAGMHVEAENGWKLDLRDTDLRGFSFRFAHLDRADLSGAHAPATDFYGAHLRQADFALAKLGSSFFNEAHLDGADFLSADVSFAHFYKASLVGAKFGMTQLDFTKFEGADLRNAGLSLAKLKANKFSSADLRDADLSYNNLEGRIDFSFANLEGATLVGSNLAGANWYGTRLAGAKLSSAQLEGADLSGVQGLEQGQLADTSGDAATELPPGLSRPKCWTS